MNDKVQLAVYVVRPIVGNDNDLPIATVRYTSYAEDGKPLAVEQVEYGTDPEDFCYLDYEASSALEMGVDVTIYTRCDIEMFPQLSKYVTN